MAIEMDVSYTNWEPPIPLRPDHRQGLPVNSPFKQMLPEQIIVPQEDPVSMVDKSLAADSAFVQMHDALKASSGYPTVSGVQENDYPCIAASGASFQLHKLNTVPFPAKVLEQFNHVEQNSEIGLFSEIQRAWLTVDSSLYLWSYDGDGVTSYDSLTEVIIGVALVKPKAGVFRPDIKHVLCLTTLVEIVLLGVQQRDANTIEILAEPLFRIATDNVPMNIISGTDEGRIFLGGKDGCLYEAMYHGPGTWLGKRSWKVNHSASLISYLIPAVLDFSEKIPIIQIEVDNSRHILFARFRNGTIEIYDLGNDGKAMSKVTSRTWSSISAQASSLARNIEAENFRTLSKICVVEQTESSFINLIGFTDTGIRIFFSTSRDSQPNRRPETLDIVHIRLPPGYSPSSPPQRPSSVHLASYRRGTTIMVSSMNDGRTLLWALSSDAFSFHDQFMELFSVHPISSRTWDMQEEMRPQPIKQDVQIQLGPSRSYSLEPPLLVTQDMEIQRKYLFLSSQGVHIAFKPRPVDHLKQLLIDNQGFENESVRSFFRLYGEIHSCAMILALASQTVSHLEKQIAEWATLAYFRYGGDPLITTTSQPVGMHHQIFPTSPTSSLQHHHHILQSAPGSPAGHISTPISSTPRVSPNMDILQSSPIASPLSPQNKVPYSPLASMIRFSPQDEGQPYRDYLMGTPQGATGTTHVHYEMSNKLKGLYLYLSRIVRQIWNHNAVHIETVPQLIPNGPKEIYHSSISTEEINIYIEKLSNLRNFLNKNIQFSSDLRLDLIHPRMNGGGSINFTNPNQVNPIIERTSFYTALQLIERIREVLGLWRIISEHNFQSVVEHMPNEAPSVLRTVSFRDLTTTGNELCAHLASALVQKYIEDHTATDCISQRLKEACPSIFRNENVLQAKAHEILIKARSIPDAEQRTKMIEQGLQTFKRIGARINIRQACELLKSVHAYVDIANLCLSAASQRDPENKCRVYTQDAFTLLEHIQHSPKSPDLHSLYDPVKIEDSRLECYRIILETYEYLLCRVENPANTLIQPSSSKKDQADAIPPITKDEALNYSKSILQTVINSDDQIAHYAFYEWFYEHQKLDKLLEIRSPHVEFYLKSKASAFGDSHEMMDLLWAYYERNGNYRAAALILNKLAQKHSSEIDLLKRIEYLSRAIICMKSCQSHSAIMSMEDKDLKTSGELLHDIEERMEVARLQYKTLEALSLRPDSSSQPVRDAIKELNEDLLDISTLYENFADRFDLPEAQLAIVYTASHNDPELVKTLWKKIMDRELASSVIKPTSVRKTLLVNKITNLAKQYMPSERYLPIEFVVQYLENTTHNLGFEREWLASALLSCGLSIHQLVDIYHKLFRSRESNSSWMRKSIQILQVSYWLFKKFCDNPSCIVHSERRHFTAKCLDLMAEYLLELQSNNNNDPQITELISRFRELQSKLERMSFN